jgi:hypothetical protein
MVIKETVHNRYAVLDVAIWMARAAKLSSPLPPIGSRRGCLIAHWGPHRPKCLGFSPDRVGRQMDLGATTGSISFNLDGIVQPRARMCNQRGSFCISIGESLYPPSEFERACAVQMRRFGPARLDVDTARRLL